MLSKSPKSLVKFKEITSLWAPCVANRRKSHSSNIPHGNHSYFKGEEWCPIRKALAKTKTKSSRTNCKPSSFMSSIWGSWRHQLGSNGLGNPWFFSAVCPCVISHGLTSISVSHFFSEHSTALASPVSWVLHCNLNLTFPVLNVAYSRVPCEKSNLAIESLASATDWALSTSLHDVPTLPVK